MASQIGTVTISGGGSTSVITLTNDSYGLGLASGFQSLSAQFASSNGVFTFQSSSFIAAPNNIGNVAVFGPSMSTTLLVGDGDTLGYIGTGDATIVAGNGNDSIYSGAGSDTIAAGTGDNLIGLGTGASAFVDSIGDDTVHAGTGADTVSVENGAEDSIYGGTGTLTVDNLGTASVIGGTSVVYAASGASTYLYTSTHNNVLVANANDGVHPSGGSVLLDASNASGGNQLWAGSGNATLIGGAGDDTLVGGQGNATLTGGGGSNDFDFFTVQGGSASNVTITDFGASSGNHINLDGYGSTGFSYALAHQTPGATSTVLQLNDGTTITLQGVTKPLTASNINYN